MIGRGFGNDSIDAHTGFEVVNTWSTHEECIAYHKQTILGLQKCCIETKTWTVWLVPGDNIQDFHDSTMPLQHLPFIFLSVWLVEF